MSATAAVRETRTIAGYIDAYSFERVKLAFLRGTLGMVDTPLRTREDLGKCSDGFFGIWTQLRTGGFSEMRRILFKVGIARFLEYIQ